MRKVPHLFVSGSKVAKFYRLRVLLAIATSCLYLSCCFQALALASTGAQGARNTNVNREQQNRTGRVLPLDLWAIGLRQRREGPNAAGRANRH